MAMGCCTVAGVTNTQAAEKSYMQNLKLKELKSNAKNTTGKDLELTNDLNVTCTNSGWTHKYYPKQKDSDGCWVKFREKTKCRVTVTYPASYKNLGIILGTYDFSYAPEDDFWNGETAFGKTTYYKNAKKYAYYKKIK